MANVQQKVLNRFLHSMEASVSCIHLDSVFEKFLRYLGIEYFSYVRFTDVLAKSSFTEVFSNYPSLWRSSYQAKNHALHDPIFQKLGTVHQPFAEHIHSFKGITPIQKRILLEKESFGIEHEAVIPMGITSNSQAFLIIANQKRIYPDQNFTLIFMCQAYENIKNQLIFKKKSSILSAREIEILRLRYRGALIKQICHELGISKSTVAFHLDNAKKKLEAKNLNEALIRFWHLEHDTYKTA